MPTVKKVMVKDQVHRETIVVEKATSHANDAFVLKKVAKAKEMVSKIKFPEHMMK